MPAFPKTARLRQRLEFKRTLDDGRKVVCTHMILFGRKRGDDEGKAGLRVGLVVSKKVGESVARNRVKRHLREGFRRMCESPEIAARPIDLVIVARAGAADVLGTDLHTELGSCFRRLIQPSRGASR